MLRPNFIGRRSHEVPVGRWFALLLAAVLGVFNFAQAVGAAVTVNTVFSFNGTNGSSPTSLFRGTDGNLYGTTLAGGTNGGFGTAFRFSTNGALTTLFSFNGTNGAGPVGLMQATDGSFYGTTSQGGTNNQGTVFHLTPPGNQLSTLVHFIGTNGALPYVGLTLNTNDGFLYGTTLVGGANNKGTVFRLATNGALTTLVSFNGTNGINPYGMLTLGIDGFLYGTTYFGGTTNNGTVYRLTTNGALTTILSFTNGPAGANPYAGLIQAKDQKFYGATSQGGINGNGALFTLDTNANLAVLAAFDGTNGSSPRSPLLQQLSGNFIGASLFGGSNNNGTLFTLSTNGAISTLFFFGDTNRVTGSNPNSPLVPAPDGTYYGITSSSTTTGVFGTIYHVSFVAPMSPTLLIIPGSNSIIFRWNSQPGITYQLQSAVQPRIANWTNLGSSVTASNSLTTTTTPIVGNTQKFYRLLIAP